MNIRLHNSSRTPCIIQVKVETHKRVLIGISVADWKKPNTYYSICHTWVKGIRTIDVRLPIVPEKGVLKIFNVNNPTDDDSFGIISCNKIPLTKSPQAFDSGNEFTKQFVQFAEDFAERASYISATRTLKDRSIYTSNDGKFVIHYVDEILDDKGKPLRTSMRVNNKTGVMEIAKKYVVKYTIPERIAILLHEFSHIHVNENVADEFEADRNALKIYCGLGYPRKEGLTAFYKVFYRTPSDLNVARMKEIKNFLQNFDRNNSKK